MRQNILVERVCGRRNCLPHGSELKAVSEERGSGIVPQGTSLVICSFSRVLPSKFSSSPSSPPNPPISGLMHRRGRSLHDSIILQSPVSEQCYTADRALTHEFWGTVQLQIHMEAYESQCVTPPSIPCFFLQSWKPWKCLI